MNEIQMVMLLTITTGVLLSVHLIFDSYFEKRKREERREDD